MTTLMLYIGAILLGETLLVALLWWAHLRFWRGRLELKSEYGHLEVLPMPDGSAIELRRIGASPVAGPASTAGAQGAGEVPVLMVHGLAMNHRNHDATEEASLARYLHRQGRDVWLVTLRSGLRKPSLFGPKTTTFSAMARHDLPAAVEAVLARTGHAQLDLTVFSMGGMLLYASLDRTLDARRIRRAAVLASPAKVRPLGLLAFWRILPAGLTPAVPMGLATRSLAFAPRWLSHVLWGRLYNPSNLERSVERAMLWNAYESIPGPLGAEFLRWSGGELTLDGAPVLPGLAKVAVPVCFFAGARDWLAPVASVRAGFDAWGSGLPNAQKHFVVLSRANGMQADYGHCDIAFGRHAAKEVFEPAARFLSTGAFGVVELEANAA